MARRGARLRCTKGRHPGKARFISWDRAVGAARRLDGDDSRAYWCPECGGYHVTGEPKRKDR
jgi:hypothetical protein